MSLSDVSWALPGQVTYLLPASEETQKPLPPKHNTSVHPDQLLLLFPELPQLSQKA